jgi:metallo-beta-lactamase family protein
MKITFWGAAQTVTGSKHLMQTDNYSLLLDCGMFQGKRSITNQLNKSLPFSSGQVDAVILSHAHLDHCGMLPILVKEGFRGKIYCTPATAEITKYILLDAAEIQQQDAEYYNKHLKEGESPISPIYGPEDVQKVFDYFEPIPYFRKSLQWTQLNENIRFKFYDAGHILGSAVTLLEIKENGASKNLVFTGDLGRNYMPILRDPEYVEEASQILLTETTYGGRIHESIENTRQKLKAIVDQALHKKSKIIVPAFALGRTQELIYMIHGFINRKDLPSLPIYIDTPLGENITEVYSKYTEDFDEEFWNQFGNRKEAPFSFPNLTTVKSVGESKALNDKKGPMMIISASGMAEGGRVLHHLKNNLGNPDNVILLVGYQAENTLGRKLQEGQSPVKIYGQKYEVKAQIVSMDELSAHADQNDLFVYMSRINGLENLFLVHGEVPQIEAFKKIAQEFSPSLTINIPAMGQSFEF